MNNQTVITLILLIILVISGAGIYLYGQYQSSSEPHYSVGRQLIPCDQNDDRICDKEDFRLFQAAFGVCVNEKGFSVLADSDGDDCATIFDQADLFPETLPVKFRLVMSQSIDINSGAEECRKACESTTGNKCSDLSEICRQRFQVTGEGRHLIKECNQYLKQNLEILNDYQCTYYTGSPLSGSSYKPCTFSCKK